ncbi:TPA: aspartate dehydrogenase [Candidatus Micrarchaeota archaeon]|nr:aspartate dehydrogenase [Candidatus Micrarchaeota archaeon]
MKIGIIGFGSIGSFLARNLKSDVLWVMDNSPEAKKRFLSSNLKCKFFSSLPKKAGGAALVVEAASQQAVPLLSKCLPRCSVMVMSVGALADDKLRISLLSMAKKHKRSIYIPSGAIGGTDAISALNGNLETVLLETTKPPASLGRKDQRRAAVFEGSAREACGLFPQNVNVSATLSLAGIGFDRTIVRIVSDPDARANTHKIFARSKSCTMVLEFENLPSEENPKTSALALSSALRRIEKMDETLQIG